MHLQLPRAVSTQALSGAGFLKMINKATDAVSKMTIKMNESDVVSSAVNARSCSSLRFSVFILKHRLLVELLGINKAAVSWLDF